MAGDERSHCAVVGIDGGNSKTDLLLVAANGTPLARRQGPSSSPHLVGLRSAIAVIESLLRDALADAALSIDDPLLIATCLAGLDLPEEVEEATAALTAMAPHAQHVVANDTFAVLRAGLASGTHGVAVVCGAGINAVGVGPAGVARFLALGGISGDWGGGFGVGEAALGAAVRWEEGRGPTTSLAAGIAEWLGVDTAADVAIAVHRRTVDATRIAELAPIVVRHALLGDEVARQLVDRCADEVAAFADAALRRSGLAGHHADVVFGGSMLVGSKGGNIGEQTGAVALVGELAAERIAQRHPTVSIHRLTAPPVVGAVALGFDHLEIEPDRSRWP